LMGSRFQSMVDKSLTEAIGPESLKTKKK
jgi:hypothetical protein